MKHKVDMTTGVGWKRVLVFAGPIMLSNLLQQLYNTVDGIVVGRYVSSDALAAVGNCATLTMIFIAVANGLSNGCGVVVAQYYGAKKDIQVKKAISTAFYLLGGIGIVFLLMGFFGAEWILRVIMGLNDAQVLKAAATYFSIYALGLVFQFVYNAISYILRAFGDSKAILYFLIASVVTNLVLDLLFVIRFNWGVAGVAVATIIAQAISMILSIVYMYVNYPDLRYKRETFVFDRPIAAICIKLGIPSTLQSSVVALGNLFMQRLVNTFGSDLMSAFTVGTRVDNYIYIPINALNAGMATFTGQNMGAGRIDRIKDCWKRVEIMSFCFAALIAVVVYIFAEPIAAFFGVTGDALRMASEMIHFMSFFICMFALYVPTVGLLGGAGHAYAAMICSASTLTVRVIMGYAMVYLFGVGYQAVWYAVPMGWVVSLTVAFSIYFKGNWQKKAIV